MTKKLDIHKIAALSQRIIEHEAAIAKCTAEIHALLGVAPTERAAPRVRRKPSSAVEVPQTSGDTGVLLPPAPQETATSDSTGAHTGHDAAFDNPHHGHAGDDGVGHDPDRVDPREDDPGPTPSFLVRGAAAPGPKP